jgi:hypothetical protein
MSLTVRATSLLVLAFLVAACAGQPATEPPASDPPATQPPAATPVAAIDIPAVLGDPAALDGRTAVVRGFLLVEGETVRLCEMAMESYPPQCGGETLTLVGAVPPQILDQLESPDDPAMADVAWGTVEVEGTIRAAGPAGGPALEITGMRVIGG